jgi:hypothetical protein
MVEISEKCRQGPKVGWALVPRRIKFGSHCRENECTKMIKAIKG